MSLQFYTPNKAVTGGLLSAQVTAKVGSFEEPGDRAIFFNLVKQTGWNTETSKGSFKDGAKIGVKFTMDEVGGFIQAIRNQRNFTFYHGFDNNITTGTFLYYFIDKDKDGNLLVDKNKRPAPREGFGLTVKKGEVEIKVSFNLAAAENLAEYLKFCLEKCYTAIYSEDKKNAEDWAAKNAPVPNTTATKPNVTSPAKPGPKKAAAKAPPAPEPTPEPDPVEEGDPDF